MLLGHTLRSKWTNPGEQLMVVKDKESGKQVYYRLDGYYKLETSPRTYEHYGYELVIPNFIIIVMRLLQIQRMSFHKKSDRIQRFVSRK